MEGDLAGPCVEELRAVAARFLGAGGSRTIDLAGVGFADSRGVALLGELRAEGITLLGCSAFLRELLDRSRPAAAVPPAAFPALPSTAERRRDEDWIAALRQGDAGARERLVRHFGPGLLATARRFLASEAEAEHALRDAFRAAFEGLDALPDGACLATWLHGTLVREAVRRLRARALQREEEASLQPLLPRFTESGVRVLDDADVSLGRGGAGSHLETLTPEVEATVRSCIDRLPETQRAVFLLCDVEGFGVAEAAGLLGVDLAEARRRLHRARQTLRLLLGNALGSARPRTPAAQSVSA